jgi:Xaa-Pro aminopeptidase
MIVSNEPGLYRTGQWGIRVENLMAVQEAEETDFGAFLRFETLSLCPIDLRMVDATLLTPDEITWINAYHARVRTELSAGLTAEERNWLEHATRAIGTDPVSGKR